MRRKQKMENERKKEDWIKNEHGLRGVKEEERSEGGIKGGGEKTSVILKAGSEWDERGRRKLD